MKSVCKCGHKPEELTEIDEEHCYTKLVCLGCKDYWLVQHGKPVYAGNLKGKLIFYKYGRWIIK
jgi:hypothetical protein